MPLTQHELELKRTALDRIRRKLLPDAVPKSIWAGQGTGQACSLCDRPVGQTEMEYELNLAADDGSPGVIRFHLRCHALWRLEVARLGGKLRRAADPG
jgi:hypothetical protein